MTLLASAAPSGSILYQLAAWVREITASSALARFALIMFAISLLFYIVVRIIAFTKGITKSDVDAWRQNNKREKGYKDLARRIFHDR